MCFPALILSILSPAQFESPGGAAELLLDIRLFTANEWEMEVAGDVDGDGTLDLLVEDQVFSLLDGHLILDLSSLGPSHFYVIEDAASAGDVNGDGIDDLIFGEGSYGNGKAAVYSGTDGSLLLRWYGEFPDDRFGETVRSAGDVNGDGFDDVLIGAPGRNYGGAAYVYSGVNGVLIHSLQHSFGRDLGACAAPLGDLNQDGHADFVVGGSSRTYVYSGVDGSVLFELLPTADSVSAAGDVNGDGIQDIILGNTRQTYHLGAAWVYSGADGTELHHWEGRARQGYFGRVVTGVGDVNGDGSAEMVLGWSQSGFQHAYVYGFDSFITPSTYEASTSANTVVDLHLDFPDAAALQEYKVIITTKGEGEFHFGVGIPLHMDRFSIDSFIGQYPFSNVGTMHGTLDASGHAVASFTTPSGIPSGFFGVGIHMAAIANPPGQLPEFSSVPVRIEIVP